MRKPATLPLMLLATGMITSEPVRCTRNIEKLRQPARVCRQGKAIAAETHHCSCALQLLELAKGTHETNVSVVPTRVCRMARLPELPHLLAYQLFRSRG